MGESAVPCEWDPSPRHPQLRVAFAGSDLDPTEDVCLRFCVTSAETVVLDPITSSVCFSFSSFFFFFLSFLSNVSWSLPCWRLLPPVYDHSQWPPVSRAPSPPFPLTCLFVPHALPTLRYPLSHSHCALTLSSRSPLTLSLLSLGWEKPASCSLCAGTEAPRGRSRFSPGFRSPRSDSVCFLVGAVLTSPFSVMVVGMRVAHILDRGLFRM